MKIRITDVLAGKVENMCTFNNIACQDLPNMSMHMYSPTDNVL